MDRFGRALRSRLHRVGPGRLLAVGTLLALVTLGAFVAAQRLADPDVARSGASVPAWAGSVATLDAQGVYDSDLDGLPDAVENLVYGTDPRRLDSSGSGIPDGWLVRHGFDPLDVAVGTQAAAVPPAKDLPPAYGAKWPLAFTPTLTDIYSHGRPGHWNESRDGPYDSGLDPRRWDSAANGVADGWLIAHGLDHRNATTLLAQRLAGPEGLSVLEAYKHATDPRKLDSDADGLPDRVELDGAPNPRVPGTRLPPSNPARADTSGSGICDGYLVAFGLDPTKRALAAEDPDRDGASTAEEHSWSRDTFGALACTGRGADPTRARSGTSAIPDGWLLRHGLDPLAAGIDARTTQSSDRDPAPAGRPARQPVTLTVLDEYRTNRPATWDEAAEGPWWGGTDPRSNDTDGDGLGDAWEAAGILVQASAQPGRPPGEPYATSSDPTRRDTDGDGLDDAEEALGTVAAGAAGPGKPTDPRRWDTDFDGIDDGSELAWGAGLDPTRADSAGDLLADGARLRMLQQRAEAYTASDTYDFPGQPGQSRSAGAWLAGMDGAAALPMPLSAQARGSLVGPLGDLDADGLANLIDPDIDNDTLLNGWEAEPRNYVSSPHGVGEFAQGRPATDPLNPETDGDTLRDDWEVRNGRPDFGVGRYNLDPSRWNSDGELESGDAVLSDDREDPDADGLRWVTFEESGRTVHTRGFTNADEQAYRTDPNRFDSDQDGLSDGWKAYWGLEYPSQFPDRIPPGAPRPAIGVDQSETVARSGAYLRFLLDPQGRAPGEQARQPVDVRDPGNLARTRTVYPVDGTFALRFTDVQEAGTNPYLADTDGDGLPDWWEWQQRTALPGLGTGGQCTAAEGPSPTRADATEDPDRDGLDNAHEFEAGTQALCADSDAGGIRDGQEGQFGLSPTDPADDQLLLVHGADSDLDGVLDFEELTGIRSLGYNDYLGAADVRTRHDNPDTDGDGLLDGRTVPPPDRTPQGLPASDPLTRRFLDLGITFYRTASGGFAFLGERDRTTDPRDGDDAGIGVPAGWLAAHSIPICTPNIDGCTPNSVGLRDAYEVARPRWWSEAAHGPWWGGARPQDDVDGMRAAFDLDRDGLRDRDGADGYEDPMPGANRFNQLRAVEYAAYGLPVPAGTPGKPADADHPLATRMQAQAFLSPLDIGATYGREEPAPEAPVRTPPCLSVTAGASPPVLVKGAATVIPGRVTLACDPGSPPVPGLAVEARFGLPGAAFGAAFTDADGRFELPVNVTPEHAVAMPPGSGVLRGNTSGTVRWSVDPSAVAPGDRTLLVRTYARDGPAGLGAAEQPVPVKVRAGARIEIAAPRSAPTGQEVPISLRLTDSAGSPMAGTLLLDWGDQTATCPGPRCLATRPDGSIETALPAPHATAGARELVVRSPGSPLIDAGRANATILLQRPADLRFVEVPADASAGQAVRLRVLLDSPAGGLAGVPVRVILALNGQERANVTEVTGSSGTATVTIPLPVDTPFGRYVATAAAPASASTMASQAQATIPVRSQPRFIQASQGDLALGGPNVASARLVEPDGATPLADALVELRLGTHTTQARTDSRGLAQFPVPGDLPLRPVQQQLSFAGDDRHLAAAASHERMVVSPTALRLDSGVAARGAPAAVAASLSDGVGHPLAGQPVRLRWGTLGTLEAVTDSAGLARFAPALSDQHALGPVTVRAEFAGLASAGLAASADQAAWTVRARAEILLPNGTFPADATLPQAMLRDAAHGTPLAGRDLQLTLTHGAQATKAAARTDEQGRFVLPLPPGQSPRRTAVEAAFAGDGQYAPAANASAVDQRVPTSTAIRVPGAVTAGRPVVVLAFVTDQAGIAVDSGEVEARVAGADAGRWPVRAGTARIALSLPDDHPPGAVRLQALYLGGPGHGPSEAQQDLAVLGPVHLRIEAGRVAAGKVAVVRVQATAGGEPLPFTQVSLAVDGLASGLVATTDPDGFATFRIEQTVDSLPVAARFAGDGTLGPAMAHVTIQPATSPTLAERGAPLLGWLALTAAIAVLALSAIAARLRAQPLEAAFRRVQALLDAPDPSAADVMAAFRILEDAAVGKALLLAPARTAGELRDALRGAVPAAAHAPLDAFIGLFEDIRYGGVTMRPDGHRRALAGLAGVVDALQAIRAGRPA